MVGIRPPSESGYALFTDNPTNLVEHCLQASVKVDIIANGQYRVIAGQQDRELAISESTSLWKWD